MLSLRLPGADAEGIQTVCCGGCLPGVNCLSAYQCQIVQWTAMSHAAQLEAVRCQGRCRSVLPHGKCYVDIDGQLLIGRRSPL